MTDTCKTCKWKSKEPVDTRDLKDIKYLCHVNPPTACALLVPAQRGAEIANISVHPTVGNDTSACRHFEATELVH